MTGKILARIHVYKDDSSILVISKGKFSLPELLFDISEVENGDWVKFLKCVVRSQSGVEARIITLTTFFENKSNGILVLDFYAEFLCEALKGLEPGLDYYGASFRKYEDIENREFRKIVGFTRECKYYIERGTFHSFLPKIVDEVCEDEVIVVCEYPKTRKSIHFDNANVKYAQMNFSSLEEFEKYGFENVAKAGVLSIQITPSRKSLKLLFKTEFKKSSQWRLLNLDNGGKQDLEITKIFDNKLLLPFEINDENNIK